MRTIYKSLAAALVLVPTLTGCVDETFPTTGATEEQLGASAKAAEALLWAMPAFNNKFDVLGYGSVDASHYDYGYPSIMHIRDVMTADMPIAPSGYDHYTYWENNTYLGEGYIFAQFIWNYYTQRALTANNCIGAIDPEVASSQMLSYLGMGYAFRAHTYLEMAQMYEFLPNNAVSSVNLNGNDVEGLTVPIVTDKTTEEEARKNPRATHQQMFEFIMSDLDAAEQYLAGASRADKTLPNTAVIYGLKARAYMWNLDYAKAAEYASKAIATGQFTPTTREQWLSTTTGFNDLNTPSWMWGIRTMKEDDVVQTGIINFTSWTSNEAQYGYAAAGPNTLIDAALYNSMSDRDFRKLSFKAPQGSTLSGQEPVIDAVFAAELPEYASFKFRPGEGNTADYNVGSAVGIPLMRIEEMYFIQAEATAQTSPVEGKKLLEDFMKTYRYPTYVCRASSKEDIIDEIFQQKRAEFWGEGIIFFDYKRLDKSVIRAYDGSNFNVSLAYNTDGRPAWMNFVIIRSEGNNNEAVMGWNNPDPSEAYTAIPF